jgi:hypothetical protein
MAMTFSAPCGIYVVLGATSEAYFEVESAMLGNPSLERIGDWHLSSTLATIMIGLLAFSIIPQKYIDQG